MLPAGRDPSTSAFISVKIETQGLTDQQEQVRILFSNITKKKKKKSHAKLISHANLRFLNLAVLIFISRIS